MFEVGRELLVVVAVLPFMFLILALQIRQHVMQPSINQSHTRTDIRYQLVYLLEAGSARPAPAEDNL